MTELSLGAVAAIAAAALLLLGLTRELAPAGGLTSRGRWMLMAGLGMGVVAAAVKLLALAAFALAPPSWMHPPLATVRERAQEHSRAGDAAASRKVRWRRLPAVAPAPAGNPTTAAKVELGQRLFHDKALSLTREVSCASCHDAMGRAGTDGRPVAMGIRGQQGRRNTPTVWNAAFQTRLFWDGRAATLEEQALGPITNPVEMGMPSLALAIERVSQDAGYRRAFAEAFNVAADSHAVTAERLAAALAAYERTLITPDSPYDRFVGGDTHALTAQQVGGMVLFESIGCVHCHAGPNFSGASVFDDGAPFRAFPARPLQDLARLGFADDTGRAPANASAGVWRIPSLRNVALTAPYFHNGAVTDLGQAVRIMVRTQLGLPVGDAPDVVVMDALAGNEPAMVVQPKAGVSESDIDAIVAFLHALSGTRLDPHGAPSGMRPR